MTHTVTTPIAELAAGLAEDIRDEAIALCELLRNDKAAHTAAVAPGSAGYTPGPWDYDMDFIVAPDPNGRHPDIYIAEIVHSDDEGRLASPEQQDANRHLIAAAPRMYETLDYTALMLTDFKPDFLQQLGLDVALKQIEAVLSLAAIPNPQSTKGE